ncbi:MAG TPA: serine hydrolase [Chthonomonadaceae bacterium]|nr:serine hydrolase [Chthonomonadaceae bacterium]
MDDNTYQVACRSSMVGVFSHRMWAAVITTWLVLFGRGSYSDPSRDASAREIGRLMETLSSRGQFSGCALVAEHGHVLYRKAFGFADTADGRKLTEDTPFNIASVTKQFTAMAIMMLAEKKQLDYDDLLSRYIPEFASLPHASGITLRHLLTHTSGIPDFGDLAVEDDTRLTETSLIATLVAKDALFSSPGRQYRYSNPGYRLLAVVIERVSRMAYSSFLRSRIFQPLGMLHTVVYDRPEALPARCAVGYDPFGQRLDVVAVAVPGDGGIFSTIDDLFKWDQALYTDRLVRQSTLVQAFTPAVVREGTSTYGFGWNIAGSGAGKYVWHTGNQAGFRAFIERRFDDRTTVILLTNVGNSKRVEICDALLEILAGRPYRLPRRSGAEALYTRIRVSGVDAAIREFSELKAAHGDDYDLGESELNTLGYQLLYGDKRVADAVAIFKLNTIEHSTSSNAFDSLGEAYRVHSDIELARQSYQTAVKLDPQNRHASTMLKELK